MGLLAIFDPTALFCIVCTLVPMLKDPSTTNEDRIAFLTDPMLLACYAVLPIMAIITRMGECVKLSDGKRALARWYLWNGAIIHLMMDGGVGSWKQLPLFLEQYKKLDLRFHGDTATMPVVIGFIEFFIHAPLCLATYYAYRRGCSWRAPVEIMACVCHIFGAIAFVLPEHLDGFPSIEVDWKLEFTENHLVYFWFGYLANFIWVFLPLYFIYLAFPQACKTVPERLHDAKKHN